MSLKEEDKFTELFQRYSRDQYTREDLNTIFRWFESNGYDIVRRTAMKTYWKSLFSSDDKKLNTSYDAKQMLNQIHHQINVEQSAAVKKQKKHFINRKQFFEVFGKIAAFLIIPLFLFSIYFYQSNGTIFGNKEIPSSVVYAPQNSRLQILLPDGTQAWLNNGSTLKYPQQFSGKSRKVVLTGEAYFKVAKNQNHPFRVQTTDINIKVTGTAFNVLAYEDDNSIVTTVEEGKVALQRGGWQNKNKNIVELTANQQSTFHKGSEKTRVKQVDPAKYTAWKDGKLVLLDDPMLTVKKKLERWYNVNIEIQDEEIYRYKYTATFTHESIEQVMKYLSMATPITYKIKLGKKQHDNSFSRKKILIGKK